jgi:hypothetical protein
MATQHIKSPPIVLVKWIDAYHEDEGWLGGEQVEFVDDSVWSVGVLIAKNKVGITLAQTWYPDDVANVIHIPRSGIQTITEIGRIDEKKNKE